MRHHADATVREQCRKAAGSVRSTRTKELEVDLGSRRLCVNIEAGEHDIGNLPVHLVFRIVGVELSGTLDLTAREHTYTSVL